MQSGGGRQSAGVGDKRKRRIRWNAALHQEFLNAVEQLGGAAQATPKGVLHLMNHPDITIMHIKSHLQKYRLTAGRRADGGQSPGQAGSDPNHSDGSLPVLRAGDGTDMVRAEAGAWPETGAPPDVARRRVGQSDDSLTVTEEDARDSLAETLAQQHVMQEELRQQIQVQTELMQSLKHQERLLREHFASALTNART